MIQKKMMAWLGALLCLVFPFSVFASEEIYCDCEKEPCICFIQLGDEGGYVSAVIRLLKEKGYCGEKQKISVFDGGAEAGVKALQREFFLPETGMLDDETLTLLIFGMLPEELDAAEPESCGEINWVPTDGGEKRHRKPTCSGILAPRKVSVRNGEALGYGPCETCCREIIED